MNTRGNCTYCDGYGWNWQLPPAVNAFALRIEDITRLSRKVTCHSCLGSGSSSNTPTHSNTGDVA